MTEWKSNTWESTLRPSLGVDGKTVIQGIQGSHQYAAQVVDAGISIPADATKWEGAAVSGALENASPYTNGVGGRFYAVVNGNGDGLDDAGRVSVWPINGLASDKGFSHAYLITEMDYNITGPDTKVVGMSVGGAGTARPAAGSVAFIANTLGGKGPRVPWPVAFATLPGTASYFATVGPTEDEPGAGSQPIVLYARDDQGRPEYCQIQFQDGQLVLWFRDGEGNAKRKVIAP